MGLGCSTCGSKWHSTHSCPLHSQNQSKGYGKSKGYNRPKGFEPPRFVSGLSTSSSSTRIIKIDSPEKEELLMKNKYKDKKVKFELWRESVCFLHAQWTRW